MVTVDLPNRVISVDLTDETIEKRLAEVPVFIPKITKGYLARYSQMVTSASTGAILQNPAC